MMTRPLTYLAYSKAREAIANADLLLFRGLRIISAAGRGSYSHAAIAAWWYPSFEPGDAYKETAPMDSSEHGGRLMCLEVREWHGGRAVNLSSQVEKYPGGIDVFRANDGNRWPEFDKQACILHMLSVAGRPYGYWNILRAACYHMPFIRWYIRPETDVKQRDKHPPFCSQAVDEAVNAGGAYPLQEIASRLTEPSDLARSIFFRYAFTLVPDEHALAG